MRQIAQLYSDDVALFKYLMGLKVNREEWDQGNRGGHFWFEETCEDADVEIIDAFAEDADGATICITLHLVGPRINWAEWYRLPTAPFDMQPISDWPPTSVRRNLSSSH